MNPLPKLKQVLLIDDEETVNFINRLMIERTSFAEEVLTRETVDGAIEYLQSNRSGAQPDLIFVDVNMPEKNGWDFIKSYRQLFPEGIPAPVIVLTSSLNPQDQQQANGNPEVVDYLSKPLSKEKLDKIKAEFWAYDAT